MSAVGAGRAAAGSAGCRLDELSDEQLGAMAARGRHDAWAVLYRRSRRFLVLYARRMTRDELEVEDLVQEALTRAWESRERYDARYPYRAWVRTILRRIAYDDQRRARTFEQIVERAGGQAQGVWQGCAASHIVDDVLRAETRERLLAVLDDMRDDDRDLLLTWAEGAAPSEIAGEMGVKPGTLRSQLFRAKERFADAYRACYSGER